MDSTNIFLDFIKTVTGVAKKPILAIVAFVMYFIFSIVIAIKGRDMAKLKEEYEKEKDKQKDQTKIEQKENASDDWIRGRIKAGKK